MAKPVDLVLIPALLCDDALYTDMLAALGALVTPHVLISPLPVMADSVADILARAPARFVLGGTSYGANMALQVARAAPDRVRGLWLMGCDPGAPDTEESEGFAAMIEGSPDAAAAHLSTLVVHPQAVAAAATFRTMAARIGGAAGGTQMRALAGRAALWGRLDTLAMPALVVWGEEDPLVPVATGRRLADELPHAHFHALKGCGHLPTLEMPDAVAAIVAEWLDDDLPHAH